MAGVEWVVKGAGGGNVLSRCQAKRAKTEIKTADETSGDDAGAGSIRRRRRRRRHLLPSSTTELLSVTEFFYRVVPSFGRSLWIGCSSQRLAMAAP